MMLWTQNAWAHGDSRSAAYCCTNGHVLDPALTRECLTCGVHDTRMVKEGGKDGGEGETAFVCNQCGTRFTVPLRG